MHYSSFTKNPMTSQISSSKFRLQSRRDFQTTYQTKQFFVMQEKFMKRHSKKSSHNVKLQLKPTNQNTSNKINHKRNIKFFNPPLVKQYLQKLVITSLIFPNEVRFISKVISVIVFHVVVIESFSNLLHFFSSLCKFVILFCKC